jgi:hypothetical protein
MTVKELAEKAKILDEKGFGNLIVCYEFFDPDFGKHYDAELDEIKPNIYNNKLAKLSFTHKQVK